MFGYRVSPVEAERWFLGILEQFMYVRVSGLNQTLEYRKLGFVACRLIEFGKGKRSCRREEALLERRAHNLSYGPILMLRQGNWHDTEEGEGAWFYTAECPIAVLHVDFYMYNIVMWWLSTCF